MYTYIKYSQNQIISLFFHALKLIKIEKLNIESWMIEYIYFHSTKQICNQGVQSGESRHIGQKSFIQSASFIFAFGRASQR